MKYMAGQKGALLAGLVAALAAFGVNADTQVIARGLFPNRAILEIDGAERLIKVGEPTPEGVLLVSSNSREAVVEVGGVQQTLTLTGQISSTFVESKPTTVTIPRSDDSHYRINGSINGYPVDMMVDTGATAVVMNSLEAERMGIDFKAGKPMQSSTAAGIVDSFLVDLRQVKVGSIEVHNIKGVVVEGSYPAFILLGNTYLSHVVMEQQAGALVLKRKY